MINFIKIAKFRDYKGAITVPKGTNLIQGHITISYPEYEGNKEGMIDYYKKWAKDTNVTESQLNDTLYNILYSVSYYTRHNLG